MNINSANFVILGNWNKKIFTPDWVKKFLFEVPKEIELQGIFNFEDLDLGFSYQDLILMPKENSLEISLKQFTEENIKTATQLLMKLFNLLPHTPIKALGFNIKYIANKNEKNELINISDQIFSSSKKMPLTQIKFTEDKDKYLLNIIVDNLNENLLLNFNFHYNQISELNENSFIEHYTETLQYLKENGN